MNTKNELLWSLYSRDDDDDNDDEDDQQLELNTLSEMLKGSEFETGYRSEQLCSLGAWHGEVFNFETQYFQTQ